MIPMIPTLIHGMRPTSSPLTAPVQRSDTLIPFMTSLRPSPSCFQVLSIIHRSSAGSLLDDQHSAQVSVTAMKALVPAWLGAGRDAADLWGEVASALPEVPPHRRLALLPALMSAMPEVQEEGMNV